MYILRALTEMTVYSALIALCVLLLRRGFGRKLTPALRMALWFILVARLVVPFTLPSAWQPFHLPQPAAQQAAGTSPAAQATTAPILQITGRAPSPAIEQDAIPAQVVDPSSITLAPIVRARPTLREIALWVWWTGMSLTGLFYGALYLRLWRRLRRGAAPDRLLLAMLAEEKARLRLRRPVRIVCLEGLGAPALLFPHLLLMPMDLMGLSDRQVRMMLRHELTHCKRGDALLNLLLCALRIVHWFNPVVWIAFPFVRADMELTCDQAVARSLSPEGRLDYANLLLELSTGRRSPALALAMAQRSTPRRAMEQRLRGVFAPAGSHSGMKAVAAAMALALLAGCFTTACQPVAAMAKSTVFASVHPSVFEDIALPMTPAIPKTIALHYDIPAWTTFTVRVDATVTLPTADAMPIYYTQPVQITQQQADRIRETLLQGKTLYAPTAPDVPASTTLTFNENYPTLVDTYGQWDEISTQWFWTEEGRNRAIDDGWRSMSGVTKKRSDAVQMMLNISTLNAEAAEWEEYAVVFTEYDGRMSPKSMRGNIDSMTPAQALAQGNALLRQMGFEDLWLVNFGQNLDAQGLCYSLVYRHGLPGMEQQTILPAPLSREAPYVSGPTKGEQLTLSLNSNGIVDFHWRTPEEIQPARENAQLLPFEKIENWFRAYITHKKAWTMDPNVASLRLNINRIEMSYLPIKKNWDFLYTPVWDFCGTLTATYKDGSQKVLLGGGDTPISFLTLNAIDGGYIDRAAGR